MNFTCNHNPQLTYHIMSARTLDRWTVLPAPLTFTCDEYLGNPEQEILRQSAAIQSAAPVASEKTAAFQAPEIDPDEFESIYLWFLA